MSALPSSALPQQLASNKQYGGFNRRYKHPSTLLGCDMNFTVFFPPTSDQKKVPVLYYLSGLTCDDTNFIQKANAQRKAAELGIALVAPDTSPRGLNIDGDSESWDFGVGAGFYVDAVESKWKNYKMYSYITSELPAVLSAFDELDLSRASICGHSMGGHGALVIGLRNPSKFKSISAFSPISNPSASNCPWGQKAFTGFLGPDTNTWKQYDATELIKESHKDPVKLPVLIDQGSSDSFLQTQLHPEALIAASSATSYPATVRYQDGYDHSYFFISSFIDDHIAFHAQHLIT